jgi:hypothetical protein
MLQTIKNLRGVIENYHLAYDLSILTATFILSLAKKEQKD